MTYEKIRRRLAELKAMKPGDIYYGKPILPELGELFLDPSGEEPEDLQAFVREILEAHIPFVPMLSPSATDLIFELLDVAVVKRILAGYPGWAIREYRGATIVSTQQFFEASTASFEEGCGCAEKAVAINTEYDPKLN